MFVFDVRITYQVYFRGYLRILEGNLTPDSSEINTATNYQKYTCPTPVYIMLIGIYVHFIQSHLWPSHLLAYSTQSHLWCSRRYVYAIKMFRQIKSVLMYRKLRTHCQHGVYRNVTITENTYQSHLD